MCSLLSGDAWKKPGLHSVGNARMTWREKRGVTRECCVECDGYPLLSGSLKTWQKEFP